MTSGIFAKTSKNCDFSRYFQFYRNIVQNAWEISLEKVVRLYNGQIRKGFHFNNAGMLTSTFFKYFFQQNFNVQKIVFMKYVNCYVTVLFNHEG